MALKRLLAKIKCPVLFIRGETKLGAVMTDDEISRLKRNFSNVNYVQISGVGHLLHLEDQGQTPVLNRDDGISQAYPEMAGPIVERRKYLRSQFEP